VKPDSTRCLVVLAESEEAGIRGIAVYRPAKLYLVEIGRLQPLSLLNYFTSVLGVEVEHVRISPEKCAHSDAPRIPALSFCIREELRGKIGSCNTITAVFESKNMLSLLAFYTALLGLEEELAEKVTIAVYDPQSKTFIGERLSNLQPAEVDIPEMDASGLLRKVLRLVAKTTLQGESIGPARIAEELGIPRSTAHRKITLLAKKSVIEGKGKYRATPRGLVSA